MRRLALLVPLLALAAGAAAPGDARSVATAREVAILDGSVRPETLRVPVNATVVFVNRGRRTHTIRAERNVWAPIVLRPRARASVKLLVPGRYPYTVDRRVDGELIAGVPLAGFRPPRGSTVTSVDHRYSVRIDARIHERTTYSGSVNPDANGTEDADLTWTTRVPALVLRAQAVGANVSLVTRSGRGTFAGRLEYSDSRRANGACAGDVAYALPAQVVLQGSIQAGRASAHLDAGLTPAASARYDSIFQTTLTARGCLSPNDADWLDETVPVDRGVRIHHPPSFSIAAWDTRWSTEGRGTPFPLGPMVAGKAFTVSSGVRQFAPRSCGDGCVESFTGSVRYVFTPLRPR